MIDLTTNREFTNPVLVHVRDDESESWRLGNLIEVFCNASGTRYFTTVTGEVFMYAKNIGELGELPRGIANPEVSTENEHLPTPCTEPNEQLQDLLGKMKIRPSVTDAVIKDMNERREIGIKEYGTELLPNNGRDALQDAYEEMLDGACYLKQKMIEEATKPKVVDKTTELVNNVRQWAKDKNIDKRENVFPQFGKVYEEVNELYTAVIEDNYEEIVDGIGDVAVTLIILSLQLDLNFETCLQAAWDEIKDRTGTVENGVFVKSEES